MREEINEHITIKNAHLPHTAIYLLLPIEGVGVLVFLAYVAFHFHDFIGQTTAIFAWLVWFFGLACYVALAALFVKVIRAGIDALLAFAHGAADVHRKFIENKLARARRELLHTDSNYVVYLENGKVTVQSVIQERYNYSIREGQGRQAVIDAADELPGLPAPIQTFHELLTAGIIQAALAQGKMVLGYVNGVLRYGSWLDLYSCGIGGVSGSGKTTTVRFLLFQALLAGARLLMIDPHIGEPEESLAAQFQVFTNAHLFAPCDDNPSAILKRVRWLSKELKRRKATGDKVPFIIFVIDEFNAVMRVKEVRDEMSTLLLQIGQEGRKFGIFAMLIGQRWSQQDIGGADIRTSLASMLAHRFTDEEQAKKLVGSRNGPRCLDLPQGHYLFRDTQGQLSETVTPDTVEADGVYIQRLLDGGNQPEISQKAARNQYSELPAPSTDMYARKQLESGLKAVRNEHQDEQDEQDVSTEQDTELYSRMQQVMRMQADGKQKAEIIRTLWGVSPGGSQAYEQANTEYQHVLKLAYERLGA